MALERAAEPLPRCAAATGDTLPVYTPTWSGEAQAKIGSELALSASAPKHSLTKKTKKSVVAWKRTKVQPKNPQSAAFCEFYSAVRRRWIYPPPPPHPGPAPLSSPLSGAAELADSWTNAQD